MSALIGSFIGAFAFSLGLAAIILIIAFIIPPLRRNPKPVYIFAMVLAFLIQLARYGGPTVINIVAGISCVALLYFQMQRAIKKYSTNESTNNNEQQP